MNTHAVEDLVSFFQATQDRDCVFNGGFVDHDGLKTSFKRRIFFDILAIFVKGGCTDAVQFAPCKHRLQKIACIHATFGLACAHDGVQLIDEQQHSAVLFLDFGQYGFESFFKFATILCACNQRAHIESKYVFVLQSLGHVAAHDTLRKTFGNSRLADARFTDKHRVVLGLS